MKKDKDTTGGELTDLPNEQYKKFFDKFEEIATLDIKDWKPVHVLAYFCKKYQEQYNVKYQFKFNSPSPTKCFEVFQIKKLAMLLSSNPSILKKYIDWVYLNKVVKAKRRLTSISFMTNEGITQEYKMNVLLSGKTNLSVDRSTTLPDEYKSIFQQVGVNVKTYGDFAFVSQMTDMSEDLINAINQIKNMGFDMSILERIV